MLCVYQDNEFLHSMMDDAKALTEFNYNLFFNFETEKRLNSRHSTYDILEKINFT